MCTSSISSLTCSCFIFLVISQVQSVASRNITQEIYSNLPVLLTDNFQPVCSYFIHDDDIQTWLQVTEHGRILTEDERMQASTASEN